MTATTNLERTRAYAAALDFLASRIDFERMQRMPYGDAMLKLDRMRELLARLDHPERAMPIVHVAGTKGKGSTSAMLAAMLRAAGRRVGLFTSPHLEGVEERFNVDGRPAGRDELVELVNRVRPVVEAMDASARQRGADAIGPTYFEVTTAMALAQFARRAVDLAILEVGLGGRLDSTNVCTPILSIITSISFDHTQQLGTTLAAIATEKAGIIKPSVPVVSGATQPEPRDVIRREAARQGCRLIELGRDFDFDYRPPRRLDREDGPGEVDFLARSAELSAPSRPALRLRLLGRHQAANAAVAVAAVGELARLGWNVADEAVREGLGGAALPARIELLGRRPTVVLDAAHNVASIEALIAVLRESFAPKRRWLIFAASADKDVAGMLRAAAGYFDEIILTCYQSNPRAMPAEALRALAAEATGRMGTTRPTPAEAWDEVAARAEPGDLVCIAGSFFLAAELRRMLASRLAADDGLRIAEKR